jgi:uncharacterized membrane protein
MLWTHWITTVNTIGVKEMKQARSTIRLAVASLVALGIGSLATTAYAADDHSGDEQCAGVIKAGKNDCATSMNDCHGHVKADANPMAWIYVPKGTCDRIVGAHVVKVKEPAPKKS